MNGNDAGVDASDAGTAVPDAGDAGVTVADAGTNATAIVVRYPSNGHKLTLRGNGAGLNWAAGAAMVDAGGGTWTYALPVLGTDLEYKPLLDDQIWSLGPNYVVPVGVGSDIAPRFTTPAGRIEAHPSWPSKILGNTRDVWIYLPPSYDENTLVRFPVIYMNDGQNLFNDATAFGGNSWHAADAMNNGAADGTIREAIILGVSATSDRMGEYTPVPDPNDGGGRGDLYLRFLVEEMKPAIDASFRTLPGQGTTAIIGSSLGGLISAYAGVTHAETFGLIGAVSPSTWWDNRYILGAIGAAPASAQKLVRVYVDSGDSGPSNDDVTNTAQLAKTYRGLNVSVDYVVQPGGQHSEIYWAQRLPGALRFLLGPR